MKFKSYAKIHNFTQRAISSAPPYLRLSLSSMKRTCKKKKGKTLIVQKQNSGKRGVEEMTLSPPLPF